MSLINLDEVEEVGRVALPNDVYSVRILDAEKRESKQGNPMIVLELEIAAPESITVVNGNGQPASHKIAGLRLTDWIVLSGRDTSKLKRLHKELGLPMQVDTDNMPVNAYKGKAFTARVVTEVDSMKKGGTNEPIINPATGAPIETYNYRVREWFTRQPQLDKQLPY